VCRAHTLRSKAADFWRKVFAKRSTTLTDVAPAAHQRHQSLAVMLLRRGGRGVRDLKRGVFVARFALVRVRRLWRALPQQRRRKSRRRNSRRHHGSGRARSHQGRVKTRICHPVRLAVTYRPRAASRARARAAALFEVRHSVRIEQVISHSRMKQVTSHSRMKQVISQSQKGPHLPLRAIPSARSGRPRPRPTYSCAAATAPRWPRRAKSRPARSAGAAP